MHRFDRFAALHVDPLWQARRIDGGQRSTGGPGGGYCTPPGRQHGWWRGQIGKAACRGRGENSVGGGSFKKKKEKDVWRVRSRKGTILRGATHGTIERQAVVACGEVTQTRISTCVAVACVQMSVCVILIVRG